MVFGITMYLYELRAFLVSFASILYFTYSKSYFFSLATHFYKTLHISFSILQYIILKYYKIIPFFIYIFFQHSNHTSQQHQPKGNQTHSNTKCTTHNHHQQNPQPITTTNPQPKSVHHKPTPANPNPQPPYPQTHHNPFCLQPRPRWVNQRRVRRPSQGGQRWPEAFDAADLNVIATVTSCGEREECLREMN